MLLSESLKQYAQEIGFVFNELQEKIILDLDNSNNVFKVLPRAAGKTTLGLFISSYLVTRVQGSRSIIVSDKYIHSKWLRKEFFRFVSPELGTSMTDFSIQNSLLDSSVLFLSLDSFDRGIRGISADFIFFDLTDEIPGELIYRVNFAVVAKQGKILTLV